METDAAEELEQALHLPHSASVSLAEKLLESLETECEFPLSAEWEREISRRREQIDRGEAELVEADRAFKEAYELLG